MLRGAAIRTVALEYPAADIRCQFLMDNVVHEPAHEMHPQTTPPPLARQSSEVDPGGQARRRGAIVLQFDPQRVGPGKETQPDSVARFPLVGVFHHVRHRLAHRNRNLFRGGWIETLGDRRSPCRLVYQTEALAGGRNVNLERRPIPPQWLLTLQS